MSAYAGQMSEMRRAASLLTAQYLQTDVSSPKKQADVLLEHCSWWASESRHFFSVIIIPVACGNKMVKLEEHLSQPNPPLEMISHLELFHLHVSQQGSAYDDALAVRYDFTSKRSC